MLDYVIQKLIRPEFIFLTLLIWFITLEMGQHRTYNAPYKCYDRQTMSILPISAVLEDCWFSIWSSHLPRGDWWSSCTSEPDFCLTQIRISVKSVCKQSLSACSGAVIEIRILEFYISVLDSLHIKLKCFKLFTFWILIIMANDSKRAWEILEYIIKCNVIINKGTLSSYLDFLSCIISPERLN